MKPEATIVLPTRNRASILLRRGLPSAMGQEGLRFEVVVVDDGSTDDTRERLAALDDARVRVVRNASPRRLPGARNAGAAVARGTWLAFLDDDDVWSPRKLRAQIDAARAAGAAWVYGRALVADDMLRVIGEDPFPAPEELPSLLEGGNWIPGGGSNVVVRADLFHEVGGFDEALRFFEDWDLWLRLIDRELPARCDEIVVARVEHRQNMVVRDRQQVLPSLERVLGKRRPVTDSDRLGVVQWLALEQARAGRRLAAARIFLGAALRYRSPGNLPAALGALLGERGLALASALLTRLRGRTHLELAASGSKSQPAWLDRYR